jgi:hypothetical protein
MDPDRPLIDAPPAAEAARHAANGASRNGGQRKQVEIEIDTSLGRRVMGWIGYLLLFLVVSSALVFLFVQFTASLRIAMALVLFMVGYMVVMGMAAAGKFERRFREHPREDADV